VTARERLVVIGNGMAGARFVEDVLARVGDDRFEIVVFGEEPGGNYNRILLSSVLAGGHDADGILLNQLSWYREHGVTLHSGRRAGWIDRIAKTVHATGGLVERYDKLVIATGSAPFVPAIDGLVSESGVHKQGVFLFRTLEDCNQILRYAEDVRTAAVIGGGLLGLEAARGLLGRGLEVHVVHLMRHLMEVQLDAGAAFVLQRTLEGMGVQVHLEKRATAILGHERVQGIAFSDGTSLGCDMVVISAGISPNVEVARQAGLHVQRGIVVHDDLSCRGDPDVYAIGECAQHRGRVYGFVAPAWEQARLLADQIAGCDPTARYRGTKIATKLKVMGVELTVMGEKEPRDERDEVVTYQEPARGIYKKLIVRDDRVAGAILVGDGSTSATLLQAFDRESPVPSNRAELLFPMTEGATGPNAASLADSAQICNCNGVSKGTIVAAARDGCTSLKAVSEATRAGTGCGTCKPQVEALLELGAGG